MKIHVRSSSSLKPSILSVDSEDTVGSLRALIRQSMSIESAIKLIHQGRILQDDGMALSSCFGGQDEVTVYISLIKTTPSEPVILNDRSARQQDKQMAQMMQNVLSQNPELLRLALTNNPKMKAYLERNPQIRQALEDPQTMQEMLEASMNPQAMQALLQGQERAMSQLENIPQGFQFLQQMHNEMAPMDDLGGNALMPVARLGRSRGATLKTGQSSQGINRTPLGNPWATSPPKARSPSAPSSPTLPTREQCRQVYQRQLEEMRDMGFSDDEANLDALMATQGDMYEAIEHLTEDPNLEA
jgi:flagellar biosynthesis GTPase FlhF